MKVLFVCMGNICRSPTAEGVFRSLVEQQAADAGFEIDSAGTHAYHVGNPPDARMQAAALARGFDLSGLRARQVALEDYRRFDLILAMDRDNLDALRRQAPRAARARVELFLEYSARADAGREVPDPYYGGEAGFQHVLDLAEEASRGLLAALLAARRGEA